MLFLTSKGHLTGREEQKRLRDLFSPSVFTRPRTTLRCARSRISTRLYNFVSSRSFALRGASRMCPSALKILAVQAKNRRPWGAVALKARMLEPCLEPPRTKSSFERETTDRVSSLSRSIERDSRTFTTFAARIVQRNTTEISIIGNETRHPSDKWIFWYRWFRLNRVCNTLMGQKMVTDLLDGYPWIILWMLATYLRDWFLVKGLIRQNVKSSKLDRNFHNSTFLISTTFEVIITLVELVLETLVVIVFYKGS